MQQISALDFKKRITLFKIIVACCNVMLHIIVQELQVHSFMKAHCLHKVLANTGLGSRWKYSGF